MHNYTLDKLEEISQSQNPISAQEYELLTSLAAKYRWFALPQVLLARDKQKVSESIELTLAANSYWNIFNHTLPTQQKPERDEQENLIDSFLSKKISKVDMNRAESSPKGDLAAEQTDCESMVSLAEFMEKIGDKKQAIEIYSKICLTFPEKSVYFAPIIEKLSKGSSSKQ